MKQKQQKKLYSKKVYFLGFLNDFQTNWKSTVQKRLSTMEGYF